MERCTADSLKRSYFVIYNYDDYVVCYIDDIVELQEKYINYSVKDLKKRFQRKGNPLDVVIDNVFYKLYRFEE